MTGMPTFSVDFAGKHPKDLEHVHKFWHKHNFPSTASCCNKVKGGIDGLISGHAYTFLDIADLKDSSGNIVHTIAKVRNPWGSEKYSGPFSDDDDSWTKEWMD